MKKRPIKHTKVTTACQCLHIIYSATGLRDKYIYSGTVPVQLNVAFPGPCNEYRPRGLRLTFMLEEKNNYTEKNYHVKVGPTYK